MFDFSKYPLQPGSNMRGMGFPVMNAARQAQASAVQAVTTVAASQDEFPSLRSWKTWAVIGGGVVLLSYLIPGRK